MSESLSPIPTPPAHLWRQIRLQYLPGIVFAAGLVAAAVIWMRWVAPPTLIGEAEAIRAEVRAPNLGTLSELKVAPLQEVKAGQEIGRIAFADPRVLAASLAVLHAENEVIRTTMDPVISQQRMLLDYERLQLDLMSERVKLASLKAQLQLAQANFTRSESLYRNKMITDERFDEVKSARDSLTAQVEAQSELVARVEPTAKNSPSANALPSPVQGLDAALKVQEEKLRLTELQLGSAPITAPIDGIVTFVYRQPGEAVRAAEPIVQITSTHVDHIVGFLRQPLPLQPKRGMSVEVRTRTFQRRRALAAISGVGSQFEPIGPTLLAAMRLPVSTQLTELGLRVNITAPASLALKPGEHVDLIVHEQ